MHLRGNTEGYLTAASKHKYLRIHSGDHITPFYSLEGRLEQMRFLEHWLRDVDTGVTREPPVKLAIRHGGDRYVWRYENEWPILALDAVLPRRFCWVAHCHAGERAGSGAL